MQAQANECHTSRAKIYLFLKNVKLFSASYYKNFS